MAPDFRFGPDQQMALDPDSTAEPPTSSPEANNHHRAVGSRGASWFRPAAAPPDLRGDVVCTWSAEVQDRHLLVPDGCSDLLWLDDGTLWLCGPETKAWEFRLPTGVTAHGIRLRPGLAPSLLPVAATEIGDRRIRLEDILGSRRTREISERVGHSRDPLSELKALVRALIDTAPAPAPGDRLLVGALLAVSGRRPVDQVARVTGLGPRRLHRRSVSLFGYGPKTLLGLIRLQRFLHPENPPMSRTLAARAATAGYYDQSHLSRDCLRITGLSPSRLLAVHSPAFPAGADPYLGT